MKIYFVLFNGVNIGIMPYFKVKINEINVKAIMSVKATPSVTFMLSVNGQVCTL